MPENVPFIIDDQFLQLASRHGPKVRGLRSLYRFLLLLKKKNAESKKVIGNKPDDEHSRLMLWNVLDDVSNRIAASDNVSAMPYEKFCVWIDMCYKCAHGNLEYISQGKDDPPGLALFAESDAHPSTPRSCRHTSTRALGPQPSSTPSPRARAKARAMVAVMFATARVTLLASAPVPLQCPPVGRMFGTQWAREL